MKKYKYRVIKKFVLDKKGTKYTILNLFRNKRNYNRSHYKVGSYYFDYDIEEFVQHPITQILLDTERIKRYE